MSLHPWCRQGSEWLQRLEATVVTAMAGAGDGQSPFWRDRAGGKGQKPVQVSPAACHADKKAPVLTSLPHPCEAWSSAGVQLHEPALPGTLLCRGVSVGSSLVEERLIPYPTNKGSVSVSCGHSDAVKQTTSSPKGLQHPALVSHSCVCRPTTVGLIRTGSGPGCAFSPSPSVMMSQ